VKFDYKKIAPGVVRPVIPLGVQYGEESLDYIVLVDSGADMNLMNAEIAEELGIDLKTGTLGTVLGITGNQERTYTHEVTLVVGGHPHKATVAFAENVGREGYGIVGQVGFFDSYKVKFDYKKEKIEVTPHKY
jgi:hypothetical protein